ncbi:MAG: SpoIID/LytB domain-containing protein, partial [Oscillospiraceae bacterium]|nr:SpoIID/LytB domain-containing protein [Oscillospiraceae bacterium]
DVYYRQSENNVDLDDIEDISDAEKMEASQTETVTETEFVPFGDDDEDFLALFTEANDKMEEETTTAVSVDVSVGADISTSETFTAKFNGSTQTVNAYDLICWIVNNEMSSSFSDEAIKAQAVAAYSYVKYHNVNGLTPSVLVKKNPPDRIKRLVSEVWGVCCYYNGSVAQTVYMASSSGYTADAKNVWGGSVPYLKSVQCPFDIGNDPNYGSTMKVSESSMRNMLESSLGISLSNNPYNWLKIQSYVDGNYVYEISIDGQKTISGRKLRENVMGHKLKSAAFDVTYRDGEFVFTTYGYGHGVGMSQNGANILAKQGYSYYEILNYYFTGIEII